VVAGLGGEESVRANVDTEQDHCRELSLPGLGSCPQAPMAVKASAAGKKVERPLVNSAVTIAGKVFNLRVGVADRSQM